MLDGRTMPAARSRKEADGGHEYAFPRQRQLA